MNVMSVYYSYRNPTENFFNSHPTLCTHVILRSRRWIQRPSFIEFPDLQFHHDPMFDSLYITGTCHFRLYFFACRDFAVSLFHLLFDPAAPYIAIPLTWSIQQPQPHHHQHLPHHPGLFPPYPPRVIPRRIPPPLPRPLLLMTVTLLLT